MYSYLEASSLLDFDQTIAKPLFDGVKYPWEVLPKISDFIIALGETLDPNEYEKRGENIWIAKSAKVYDSAYLIGPLIVCANAEIRHCAFIRGSCRRRCSYRQFNRIEKFNYFQLCSSSAL